MSLAILELNDAGIQVSIAGELILSSPGYAVLHNDVLHIGEDGLKKVRLYPGWTNNRFWQRLSTEPIPNRTDHIRHHADLAFCHLESVWQQISSRADEVIFAVPGSFDAQQLGLLLGMARECGMPVSGLIDSALASVCEQKSTQTIMHLDIQLHQIMLSVFQQGEMLTRTESSQIAEVGLFTCWDRWANIIADLFIQNTRFDPMHEANSEQQLFNQLPDWIKNFGDRKACDFALELNQRKHSVSVSSEKLLTACTSIYPQIVQQIRNRIPAGQNIKLCLSDNFSGFPGLAASLNLLQNCEIIHLPANAAASGISQHLDAIHSTEESTHYITQLPGDNSGTSSAPSSNQLATHLLFQHTAVSLGKVFKLSDDLSQGIKQDNKNPHCTIYQHGAELLLHNHHPSGSLVNNEAVMDQVRLQPGDQIQINDQLLGLITVVVDHGA